MSWLPFAGVGMKSSAPRAAGKWPSETHIGRFGTMVIFAALAAAVAGDALARGVGRGEPVRLVPVAASRTAPLPRPRPVAAPEDRPRASDRDASPGTAAERAPSACRQTLTEDVAIAPSIAPIRGTGACGGEDLVRLEAVVLPDKRRIAVRPAAVLRCTMASALAAWIRSDIAPLADSRATAASYRAARASRSTLGRSTSLPPPWTVTRSGSRARAGASCSSRIAGSLRPRIARLA